MKKVHLRKEIHAFEDDSFSENRAEKLLSCFNYDSAFAEFILWTHVDAEIAEPVSESSVQREASLDTVWQACEC